MISARVAITTGGATGTGGGGDLPFTGAFVLPPMATMIPTRIPMIINATTAMITVFLLPFPSGVTAVSLVSALDFKTAFASFLTFPSSFFLSPVSMSILFVFWIYFEVSIFTGVANVFISVLIDIYLTSGIAFFFACFEFYCFHPIVGDIMSSTDSVFLFSCFFLFSVLATGRPGVIIAWSLLRLSFFPGVS